MKQILNKIIKFFKKNLFFLLFFSSIIFVGLVLTYKIFFTKPTYIFVKAKVSQGLWWVETARPSFWYIKSFEKVLKNKEKELDLSGKPQSEIIDFKVYPSRVSNQYDVYLTMKLKVEKINRQNKYLFKRSTLGIGSAVDFEFPSLQFSVTVTDISEKPFKENYQEKIIYLNKPFSFDFEYDSIKVGDKYFNGKEAIIEILDKQILNDEKYIISYQNLNNLNSVNFGKNIMIIAKIKVKKNDQNYIFAEEQVVKPGAYLFFETENFRFDNYLISKIE
ncbi:MAG: hypothetical protein Fur009_6190 [Candidatus Microgenomates bacterium]